MTRHRARQAGAQCWTRIRQSSCLLLLSLILVDLQATVVINEFMAVNQGTVRDDFGDASDWIELHNPGPAPVNLEGWALTDRPELAARWFFPDHNLEPGGYLLVFASGRNRRLPGAPLHTSFSLSAGGEYLALLRPNGSPATEFAPAYPRQVADVSYGFATASTRLLVAPGTAGQAGVPVSQADFETNFADWQTSRISYSNPGWQDVQLGVGYDVTGEGLPYGSWIGTGGNLQARMRNINESAFIRVLFVMDNPDMAVSLRLRMRWDDGFIAYLNGVQVASHNAPANPTWNSGATADRLEFQNEDWTDFSPAVSSLEQGTNVLAIHGLNWRVSSSDFLILPALEITESALGNSPTYFVSPTPNGPNARGGPLGPALSQPVSSIPRPSGQPGTPPALVSVRVDRAQFPLAPNSVRLVYRVMFNPEQQIQLRDDGQAPDAIPNDGVYSGALPTSDLSPGQMLRWRFEATDTQGTVGRAPAFLDPADGDYYYGTVAQNPDEASSALPIFHHYIENPAAADTQSGTRASIYYLDRFYDNVQINLHGQSSLGFPKKSYNLDFNADNRFVWHPDASRRVKDVDLLSNYADKTRLRNTLAHEIARLAAAPYHFAFPIRVQRNGQFHGVMDMMEDGDDRMLERNGLDPEGALYKLYNDLSNTNRAQKKTRREESHSDLQSFINVIDPGLPLATRQIAAYDQVNIAATINYLVTRQFNSDMDHGHKNYYMYRDTRRTREWQPMIWDVDLSWGHDWTPELNYFDDNLSPNHSLDAHAGDNRLYYLIYAFPEMRAMFLRRMRTLMDTILQPPNSSDPLLEIYMRELVATIDPDPLEPSPWTDGDRDFTLWGTWGRGLRPRPEVDYVIANYLVPRRLFLFDQNPASRPRLPRHTGDPIPDTPQVNVPGMVTFHSLDYLPVSLNQAEEYIILQNNTADAVDLSGWTLEGGIRYSFLGGTVIPAGDGTPAAFHRGLLHVTKDAFAFRNRATDPTGGQRRFVQGNYTGQLSARGETVVLRDRTGLVIASLTYEGTPTSWQNALRISELHYHPAPPTPTETQALPGVASNDFEFLEFLNIGSVPLDLGGVQFTQGITFAFPAATMAPGARVILAKNPTAFALRYPGIAVPVLGPYDGSLDNAGEQIQFTDPVGENVLDFNYRDGWYPVTDGLGHSLVIRHPDTLSHLAYSQPVAWAISLLPGGSPGLSDPAFAQAYYGWDNFHFTGSERDLPNIAGPFADPDLDGRLNWQEYAFATNPRHPDSVSLSLTWVGEASNLRPALRFRRAAHALDLQYELLTSDDLMAPLNSWTVVATQAANVTPIDEHSEWALFVDTHPATAQHRFLRIRATYHP